MTLLELAERCEQAAGPDRELDMLIDCGLKGIEVIYPTEGHPMAPGRGGRIEAKGSFELLGWIDPGEANRNFSPCGGDNAYLNVTASLDAAMTLVPEGWGRCIEQERMTRECEASLSPPGCEPWGPKAISTEGSTLALALCAAALRARATL